jgi:cytochrome P450
MRSLVADKRRTPGDDVLGSLIAAQEGDDRLTDEEIVQQVVLLYTAGHETTVNLIANALAHLLRAPDQLARLRDDPSLDTNATEEALRLDGPATMTERRATVAFDVGGQRVEPGDVVVLGLAAADRDPRKWGSTAVRLDVARPDARDHVAFGGGPHYCLGAALARLEASIAIPAIVRRFPDLELADVPCWEPRLIARVLRALPVRLRARTSIE